MRSKILLFKITSPNPLRPYRIIRSVLRLEDHAAGLEAPCRMIDSHRDLQSGTFATGLQHKLRYLGSILRIALTPHLATANDYCLRRMATLMYRHIRIRHHHIENKLRHILPVFMSDASGRICLRAQVIMHRLLGDSSARGWIVSKRRRSRFMEIK